MHGTDHLSLRNADQDAVFVDFMNVNATPAIRPVRESEIPRPFWSVMIPTYDPLPRYLEQTLRCVLDQDPGAADMQIEVVDDCSQTFDVAEMVEKFAGSRVRSYRTTKNLGLAGCWNTCIERSVGKWTHILHQDDMVMPGFFDRLRSEAEKHPEVSLLATRSFFVDEDDVIFGVTERLRDLENAGYKVDDFFYATPIQCPGVVVKRSFYETRGGFRPDLTFTLDCEMWTRVIGSSGGVVTADVLARYRMSDVNTTTRLMRRADALRDLERLNKIFAERYPDFDRRRADERIGALALQQAAHFSSIGDTPAARANLDYWKRKTTTLRRLRRSAREFAKLIVR